MSQKIKTSVEIDGSLSASQIANATVDTDKFLVSDNGTVKYRTGAEMLSDLGVSPGIASILQHQVKAGVSINKGQAVYVTSADGTNMIVGLASNASEATSSKTMGLLNATVVTNGFADVVTEGLLDGLDTSTATVGDPVWLGTSGNLIYGLANKPYAPNHLVFIGIVTRVNANNGEIFVKVQNGFELDEIHDVDLKTTTKVNGHLLGYNGSLWVNKTIAEWLGYTPYNASNPAGYISSYTETDTLQTVTDRGSVTTNPITINSTSLQHLTLNNRFNLIGSENFHISNNAYYSSGFKYKFAGNASKIALNSDNSFVFQTALTGTPDAAVTFENKFWADSAGNALSTGSMRSPIFYDYNDTTYYGDFNSTTRQYQAISFGDSTRYSAINTTINGAGAGDKLILYGGTSNYDARLLVGADYDMLFKSQGNSAGRGSFKFYSGLNSSLALTIDGTQGFRAGTSYNNSPAGTYFSHTLSGVGTNRVVNFDGNGTTPSVWWTNGARAYAAIDAKDPGMSFWANNGSSWQQQMEVNYGNVTINTDIRSPIFYDSNNTGYYVDPASTSRLNTLTLSALASDDGMIENNTGGYFHLGGWGVGRTAATAVLVNTAYRSDISDSVPWSGVTSKPENIMYYSGFTLDANTMPTNSTGFTYSVNAPYTGPIARFSANGGYDLWLNSPYGGNGYGLAFRTRNGDAGSFNSWQFPAVYNVNYNGGGSLYSTIYYDSNDTSYYSDPGSNSRLYKLSVHRGIAGGGQNIFTGLEGVETANGRGQIVISSSYSDMVIASSQDNNQHGSTLTFAAYNPSNSNQYRKFVINQGNWGSRKHMLSFGYSDTEQTNPHGAINSGVNTLTIDGLGRNIGIRSENPAYPLDVNGIINTPSGYISVSNPWGTANSAFFPNGITTAGGTNWIYGYTFIGNAPANGAGHEFFTSGSSYSTGDKEAGSSMRAPIFYDRNDTGFYLDPNSTTTSLVVAGAMKQNNTLARPSVQWGQSGNVTGALVIKLPGTSPGNYGMIHAVIDIYEYNANNVCTVIVGGHNWSTQWHNLGAQVIGKTNKQVRLAVKDGKYCIVLGDGSSVWEYGQVVLRKIQNGTYYNGTMDLGGAYSIGIESDSYSWVSSDLRRLDSQIIIASSQTQAPIYYDYNDTGYYVDPTATSKIVRIWTGAPNGNGTAPRWDTSFYVMQSQHWYSHNGAQTMYVGEAGDFVYIRGYSLAEGSFRAPIFYDSNNTAYYIDAAGASNLYELQLTGASNKYLFINPGTGYEAMVRVQGGTGSSWYIGKRTSNTSQADTSGFHFYSDAGGDTVFGIDTSGTARAKGDVVAYSSSDKQLKDNIEPIENALEKVKQIGGYTFDWNDKQDTYKGHDVGIIAQEIEAVLPEVVITRDTGYKAVKYEKIVPLLIEAIKEQQTQIEELKELVNKLINK